MLIPDILLTELVVRMAMVVVTLLMGQDLPFLLPMFQITQATPLVRAVGAHPLRKAYCRRHPPQKAYWSIHALRSYLLLDDQPICGAFLCLSSVYVFGFALEAWVGLC
ncbi:hypothetical protein RHGRI_027789 [Rhododendron griersonianum]|uniref:Uncharacterized protein n=1 Tax=Rhododendron griersonianum TaxID=479676 RepID=A0AAV6J1S9_9ERIC|nr:hypothetical protein RHGRI_027789 [Rhododendron griersonianum]